MFVVGQGRLQADDVGLYGQFPAAALDEGDQGDGSGTPEVEDFVHGGAYGAPRLNDVIDQDDMPVFHGKGNLRGLDLGVHADAGEVIPVEADVQLPQGRFDLQELVQALRNPYAAGVDADHRRLGDAPVLQMASGDACHALDQIQYGLVLHEAAVTHWR